MSEHADLRQLVGLWGRYGTAWIAKHLQAQGAVIGAVAYLVWTGEYEDRTVLAVYGTAERAQRHADSMSGTSVGEMPVDVDLPPRIARGEKSWFVRVDLADGRVLDKTLWDRPADEQCVEASRRWYSNWQQKPKERCEFVFEWQGWATEERLLEVVEDARQAWVAKYGVALKPPEPRYVAPPKMAVELERERAGRLRLEDMYRDLQEGLERKVLEGSAGAKLAAAMLAEKGVLTPGAIAGLAFQVVVQEAVETLQRDCIEAVPVEPEKKA